MPKKNFIVSVYLDTGNIYSYEPKNVEIDKARERADAIIKNGYTRVTEGCLDIFPPYRIRKVSITGDVPPSKFPDTVHGV